MRSVRLLQLLLVLLTPLLAVQAEARPSLAVADFPDANRSGTARGLRNALVSALERGDAVDLVPFAQVRAAAKRKRISARELGRPSGIARAAGYAGADGVVLGRVTGRGRSVRLSVQVLDPKGRELWTKDVGVKNGELSDELADRFARAFAAAVGVVADPEPARPAAQTPRNPEPVRPEPAVTTIEARDPDPASADEPVRGAPPSSPRITSIDELPRATQKPQETITPSRREEDWAREGPLEQAPEPDDGLSMPRPPWVEMLGAGSFNWRSYRFCPEVESCDLPAPAGSMAPVTYTTERPYSGFAIGATFFPLRSQDNLLRGLGIAATYGRSLFLRTRYLDKQRQEQVFGSTQQRFGGELLWRVYYRLDGMGDGYVGVRAGYLSHAFLVDENPKIVDSSRGGLILGAEGAFPFNRYISAEARFSGVPLASPGEKERAIYGSAASGGGFTLQAGFSSDLGHPEWHVAPVALFETTYFGDRYANVDGGTPRTGRALEQYYGAILGLRASF